MHQYRSCATGCLIALAASGLSAVASADAGSSTAASPEQPLGQAPQQLYYMPPSISPEARAFYDKMLPIVLKDQAARPVARTAADFEARHDALLVGIDARNAAMLKQLNMSAKDLEMAGVGVVDLRPAQYQDDGTILIHVHGGAFVQDSAHSAERGDALMALATGKRIISVDYTVAPKGRWQLVTDQVIGVYKALLADGHPARSIGLYGDSAGGDIVAGSVLKLRDQGVAIPGALVLLSPATDLGLGGDTVVTLRDADPVLNRTEEIRAAFTLYADPADWKNPYVSPVYGDFSKPYPPVLLQAGTKERVLSDSVRLYQAIKIAGGEAELDVYEGMTHVFQSYMMGTPEQKAAYAEIRRFWLQHLVPAKDGDAK
jgi:epsilon-lactone hydrolase